MFSVRFLGRTGLSLVLAGLAGLSLNAVAHQESPVGASSAEALDTTSNLIVVKDPKTGELRLPNADEAAALQTPASVRARAASVRTIASQPLQKFHSNGAHGARMTQELISMVVAVKQPDGSYAMRCFENREQAEAAMGRTSMGKPSNAATTE